MKKYFIILSIYIVCTVGCAKNWTNKEKNDFINDCLVVGGTEEVCFCVLGCLEKKYDNYQTALIDVPKSELDERINICLQQCE